MPGAQLSEYAGGAPGQVLIQPLDVRARAALVDAAHFCCGLRCRPPCEALRGNGVFIGPAESGSDGYRRLLPQLVCRARRLRLTSGRLSQT